MSHAVGGIILAPKLLTSRWSRPILLGIVLLAGAANLPFWLRPGHWLNDIAIGVCGGSAIAQIVLWISSRQFSKRKEEKPSSASQQPTSGTSQNPSPSPSPDPSLVARSLTIANPFRPSQNPSASVFQPEARLMPVVGFRSWHVTPHHRLGIGPGWRLHSYNQNYGMWMPGENKAACHAQTYTFNPYFNTPPDFHTAPKAECSCGFYVLTDFDMVPFETVRYLRDQHSAVVTEQQMTMMVGAVVGWGKVVQHGDEGWRAEKVQVIALLDCKVSPDHLRITHEVAESYGVPVLGRKALELLAKEYGDPLPQLVSGKAR
jgi:hypothetical protein